MTLAYKPYLFDTGVYAIINKINDKFYIGSASYVGDCPSKRGFYCRWSLHKRSLNNGTHDCPPLQNSWNKHGEDNFEFVVLHVTSPHTAKEFEQIYINLLCPHYNISKEVIRGFRLGLPQSEEHKKKIAAANSKEYYLVSPEGLIYEGKNLAEFCRKNSLNRKLLCSVINNKRFHHNGWTSSLLANKLYKKAYADRGIVFRPSCDRWCVQWKLYLPEKIKSTNKNFKNKEDALLFRDNLEKEGYKFLVNVQNWRVKLKTFEATEEP